MAKDKTIYGKRCRWYTTGYMWISDDGKLAAVSDKNNPYNTTGIKTLKRKKAPDGRVYVRHPYGHIVYVEDAVKTCFCPPPPNNFKKHEIHHRDGRLDNCHYKNLEWVDYHYHHTSSKSVTILLYGYKIKVNDDGTVIMSGKKKETFELSYNSDLELFSYMNPFIEIPDKKSNHIHYVPVEEVMKKAGFVNGDDAGMKIPGILHKDNDYMNCSADNLEWIEYDDPKYNAFFKQRMADIHQKNVKINPGRTLPGNW